MRNLYRNIVRNPVSTVCFLFLLSLSISKTVDYFNASIAKSEYSDTDVFVYVTPEELPDDILDHLAIEDALDEVAIVEPQPMAVPIIPVEQEKLDDPSIIYPDHKVSAETVFANATLSFSDEAISEIRCLALNVFFEAGREDFFGKTAVSNVTNKRKDSKFWKSSYCGVIKAGYKRKDQIGSCHFSWYCDGKHDRIYLYSKYKDGKAIKYELNKRLYKAWVDSIEIAIQEYIGESKDLTGGATHYYNPRICYKSSVKINGLCHPKWAAKGLRKGTMKIATGKILKNGEYGNHLFLVEVRAITVMKAGF